MERKRQLPCVYMLSVLWCVAMSDPILTHTCVCVFVSVSVYECVRLYCTYVK